MLRTTVNSSAISSIGQEGSALEVEFSTGNVYRYDNVADGTAASLSSADSVGKAFAAAGLRSGGTKIR